LLSPRLLDISAITDTIVIFIDKVVVIEFMRKVLGTFMVFGVRIGILDAALAEYHFYSREKTP